MNLNNFTLKSQEVVQTAQQLTQQLGHQQIENEHLFKALLTVDDNVLPFVFKKLQVNFSLLENLTDQRLKEPSQSHGRKHCTFSRCFQNTDQCHQYF